MVLNPGLLHSPIRLVLACIVIAIAYYITAKLGLFFYLVQYNSTPVWPPTGICIALMVIFGYRLWPGILAGAILVNIYTQIPVATAYAIGIGNTLEVVIATYLIRKYIGSTYPLSSAREFFKFVALAAVLSTSIGAVIGVTSLWLSNQLVTYTYWSAFAICWIGKLTSTIVFVPLILTWMNKTLPKWSAAQQMEFALLILVFCLIMFSGNMLFEYSFQVALTYLLIPFVVWSAFRFDMHGTSLLIGLFYLVSIVSAAMGYTPYETHSVNESALLLIMFVGVIAFTSVALTATVGEYNRAEAVFRASKMKPNELIPNPIRNEDKQKLQDAIFRSVTENSPDHIMMLDTEAKILYINFTVPGLSVDEVIGRSAYEFVQPDQVPILRNCYEQVARTGEPGQFQLEYRNEKILIYFENRVAAVKQNGNIVGLTVTSRDVTPQILSKQELQAQRDRITHILNTAHDGFSIIDMSGTLVDVNPAYCEMTGYTREELLTKRVYELDAKFSPQEIKARFGKILNDSFDHFETKHWHKNGSTIDIEISITATHVNNEPFIYAFVRDISERKKVQQIKEQLLAIIEATPDFVGMCDKHGKIMYINAAGCQMMGFSSRKDIKTTTIADYHPKSIAEKILHEGMPVAKKYGVWHGETKILGNGGVEIPVHQVILAHRSASGQMEYFSTIARNITDRIAAENKVRESQSILELVLNTIPERVYWKDTKSTYMGCNKLFASDVGMDYPQQVIGKNDLQLPWAELAEEFIADDKEVMDKRVAKIGYEQALKTADGRVHWYENCKIPLLDRNKKVVGILGTYQEITERKHVEEILTTLAKQSLSSAAENEFFDDCVMSLAKFYNTKYAFIAVLSDIEVPILKSFAMCTDQKISGNFAYPVEEVTCKCIADHVKEIVNTDVSKIYPQNKLFLKLKIDGLYSAPLIAPNGKMIGIVGIMDCFPLQLKSWAIPILDIYATRIAIEMERKRTEEELHGMATTMSYQASHDVLTELINRREFDVRLQNVLHSAQRDDHHHALCYLDLDQFKVVNDTCGHIAGDHLLIKLSLLLQGAIRESDTIARLGGDEFGVLLQDCPIEKAMIIAQYLLDVVKSYRFTWEEKVFEIGVSIGLVPINRNTLSIEQAMSTADSACYVAKDLGRNRIHVYQEDDTEFVKRQGDMRLVTEITQALKEDRLTIFKQSIKALNSSGTIRHHHELLVRMIDRDGGILNPNSFISAAERYNLMPSIDKWVIESAFRQIAVEYAENTITSLNTLCSINLSGTTLSDNGFIEFMHTMLQQYRLPAEIICFEITETAAITNITRAMGFISQFKAMGFLFALDDFGAGLSSYSYLKNLPVDFIKIDGKFVSDINIDPLNRSIVESINQVGHTMGIKTIAEWVDSEAVLTTLSEIGVDFAQGYAISRPSAMVPNVA